MAQRATDNRRCSRVEELRRASRQQYLKEREQKKLEELRDLIDDEHRLFGAANLSQGERRDLRHKERIYDTLTRKRAREQPPYESSEYRIPDAYDDVDAAAGVSQAKRFAVASRKDPAAASEEKTWEEQQIVRAFGGSENKRSKKNNEYEFVFAAADRQAESMMESAVDDVVNVDAKSKLATDRKSLPIHPYRDELLRAINDHQVLVIVGETGSGKTTQIPQYLHEAGYTKRGMIACTQPRRVAAMSVAARVSREIGVKLGHEVGYSIRFEERTSGKTLLKYLTDGMMLREFFREPDLASYRVVMVDEAHERTVSTDILLGLVKDISRFRPDLKLLISSATLDAVKFSNYFDNAPIFKIPGRRYPVDIYYTEAPVADRLDAAVATALQIHVKQPPGDVLVFLTGQEEIEAAEELLKHRTRGLGTKVAELIICPIYANLPTELQAKIFEPTPEGARKVVLATNIAETSLTIDGIKYVVDPGFAKVKSYNPRTGMESLPVALISKASADQRAGRSGRTGPGKCYRLCTAENFRDDLEDNTIPEIQRTNLASVVLTLKGLGLDPANFDFMDPPSHEALMKARELLRALDAIDQSEELTKTGRRMAEFPLDPMLSKMIVASEKYKCSEEIISIAAMLSVGGNSIFYRPKDKKQKVHADSARLNFHAGNVGDHVALLKVYNSWKETDYSTRWCYENYIQVRSMKRARDVRDQLEGLLQTVGIELTTISSSADGDTLLKKAVASGFAPNTAKLQKHGCYRTIKQSQTVHIHPSSGLGQAALPPRWIVFHELVLTTKEYVRHVTEIKPEWLVEIAPHYYGSKDVEDPSSRKMPRGVVWITCC